VRRVPGDRESTLGQRATITPIESLCGPVWLRTKSLRRPRDDTQPSGVVLNLKTIKAQTQSSVEHGSACQGLWNATDFEFIEIEAARIDFSCSQNGEVGAKCERISGEFDGQSISVKGRLMGESSLTCLSRVRIYDLLDEGSPPLGIIADFRIPEWLREVRQYLIILSVILCHTNGDIVPILFGRAAEEVGFRETKSIIPDHPVLLALADRLFDFDSAALPRYRDIANAILASDGLMLRDSIGVHQIPVRLGRRLRRNIVAFLERLPD
jgi:hypothetical protein